MNSTNKQQHPRFGKSLLLLCVANIALVSCYNSKFIPQDLTIKTIRFCELVNLTDPKSKGLGRGVDLEIYAWTGDEVRELMRSQISGLGGKTVPYSSIALVDGKPFAPCYDDDVSSTKITFDQFEKNMNLMH